MLDESIHPLAYGERHQIWREERLGVSSGLKGEECFIGHMQSLKGN